MNLNGHMGVHCIRDGLTHNISFQLSLLVFDICNTPIACTCHLVCLMSLWGQTSRAVFACCRQDNSPLCETSMESGLEVQGLLGEQHPIRHLFHHAKSI